MSRIASIASLAFLAAQLPALAGEPLPGRPDTLHELFNATAAEMGFGQRLSLPECTAEKVRTCSYAATGNVRIDAVSPEGEHEGLAHVMLFAFGPFDGNDAVAAIDILMAAYTPKADKEERERVFLEALKPMLESDKVGISEARLDGVLFSTGAMIFGFVFMVSRP